MRRAGRRMEVRVASLLIRGLENVKVPVIPHTLKLRHDGE